METKNPLDMRVGGTYTSDMCAFSRVFLYYLSLELYTKLSLIQVPPSINANIQQFLTLSSTNYTPCSVSVFLLFLSKFNKEKNE